MVEQLKAIYPRTPEGIQALPYRLEYGHWGMTASTIHEGQLTILAYAGFPVGSRGPYDPPEVKDRVFAELDAKARTKLAELGGSTG